MKSSRRILAMLLCILMLLSVLPTAAFADDAIENTEETEYAAETAEEELIPAEEPEEPDAAEDEEVFEAEPTETEDEAAAPEEDENEEAAEETVPEEEVKADEFLEEADDNYNGSRFDGDLKIKESVYSESYSDIGSFEDYCLDILNHFGNYSGNIDLCYSGQNEIVISADLWNAMQNFIPSDGSLYVNRKFESGTPRWVFESRETASEAVVLSAPTVRDEGEKLFFTFANTEYPTAKWNYSFGEAISDNSALQYEDRLSVYGADDEVVAGTSAYSGSSLGIEVKRNALAANCEYYIAVSPPLKLYNNMDEIYAAVRAAIVNRENIDEDTGWVELPIYLGAGIQGSPDFEAIFDFYKERSGMMPYEGDYLRNQLRGTSINMDNDHWTFRALPITTREQEDMVDAKVAEILSSSAFQTAMASGSNEAKAQAAFNWVVSNVRGSGSFNRLDPINHTGYSAFIQGYGTCEAMAIAVYRLCREMGVPCRIIMGVDSGAHTYNIIQMDDGYWYYADPTSNTWKKDYTSFRRATEQEQYRSSAFVRNYLSKIKGYNDAVAPVVDVLNEAGTVISSEASLLGANDFIKERIDEDRAAGINSTYTVRLKKDLTIISNHELDYNEFSDYSDRVIVDLDGHKLSTLNGGNNNYICVRELKNGKISMPTNSKVTVCAGSNYLDDNFGGPYNEPYTVSNVAFVGVDGSKKLLTNTDQLLVGPGVKIDSSCSVSGIPCIHLESGAEFDCSASIYALETHMNMDEIRYNGGDIILGGNLTLATWMDYGGRTVINNLTVTTGSKLNSGAEYIVNGSLKLNGRTYIYDSIAYLNVGINNKDVGNDNSYSKLYEYISGADNTPITICTANEESVSISGILDTYMLGEPDEAPVHFCPVSGYYKPGSQIAAISAKGILYKDGKIEKAITNENCAEYFYAYHAEEKDAYPALENGILIIAAPSKTIIFDANGGYCETETMKYYLDSEYGTLPVPLKENCSFVGWFTKAEGGDEIFADTSTTVNWEEFDVLTLYAHWEMDNKVEDPKFYSGGKIIGSGAQLKYGAEITIKSETRGATIYYTTDKSHPEGGNAIRYVEPFTLDESGWIEIHAVAVKEGYENSRALGLSVFVSDGTEDYGTLTEEDIQDLKAQGKTARDIDPGLWVAGIPKEEQYCGSAIKIDSLRVYHHNILLRENTDYTVKYANNTNVGTAKITISGKGNYSGSRMETFEITALNLGDAVNGGGNSENLILTDVTLVSNGRMQKGTTTAVYRVNPESEAYTALKAGKDFTYGYTDSEADYTSVGRHTVYINGMGNYTGSAAFTEEIVEKTAVTLISSLRITAPKTVEATGKAVCPEFTVYDSANKKYLECGNVYDYENKKYLESSEDKDFTVYCYNNILPGTATAVITGHGAYSGTKTVTFKVNAISITKAVLENALEVKDYTGSAQTQSGYSLIYKYKSGTAYVTETLTEGDDYLVSYTNNINAGTNKAAMIFTGIGRFSGTLKKTFTITQHVLSEEEMTPSEIGEVRYTKGGSKPAVTIEYNGMTLKEGTDYTVKYSNNNAVGNTVKVPTVTVTGKGNYKGTLTKYFTIGLGYVYECRATANDFTYTGKPGVGSPSVTLYDTNGVKLAAGTDYDKNIVYRYEEDTRITRIVNKVQKTIVVSAWTVVDVKNDIIPAGTALVAEVTGIKNYGGVVWAHFSCASYSVSKAKVTLVDPKGFTYSGTEIRPTKDDIIVSMNNVTLQKTDYEIISYETNVAKGTGKLTIHGLGDYCGTKTITFKINAKSVNRI